MWGDRERAFLGRVRDQFERLAYDVVVAGGGRVVKMIGDEVMFLADDPVFAALEEGLKDRYPNIRSEVRASILVANRRWNLKLKNGIDVRLPEAAAEQGLATLAALDRDKQILTRDITAVDLRLADRVTVRLSDSAAQAREDLIKGKKAKRKGGDA